jgi:hypothetical protein
MSRSRSFIAVSLIGALVATVAIVVLTGPMAGDQRPEVAQREMPLPREVAPGMPGALLQEYKPFSPSQPDGRPMPGGWSVAVRALQPGTLDTMPDRDPFDLGYSGSTLVSPDGRSWAISSDYTGEVRIFDLETWTETGKLQAEKGIRIIAWSDDGKRLVAMRDFCLSPGSEGICPGGWLRDLWEIDVASMGLRHVGKFDFQSYNWHFDGRDRLVALALRTDLCCGIGATEPPFVALVDLSTGKIEAEIPLPALLAGQPNDALNAAGAWASFHPAAVLSADAKTLYVFDSVDHHVTAVDLVTKQVISRTDLNEPRSWFTKAMERVGSFFIGTAEAKGGPQFFRQAAVSPDGRYLVSSGIVSFLKDDPEYEGESYQRPAGLLVIDTMTMSVVYREKTSSTFIMSADGRWLLSTGAYWDDARADSQGFGGGVGFGLKVIDLVALAEVGHLWPDEMVWLAATSPDSRFGYILADGPGMLAARESNSACLADCRRLSLVDLATGRAVAERLLGADESIASLGPSP